MEECTHPMYGELTAEAIEEVPFALLAKLAAPSSRRRLMIVPS